MKERSFDEMIAYCFRVIAEMDIAQVYKMELLGMVTALGYKHEKTAQQWIPCSERLPECEGVNSYILTIVDEDGTMTTMGWYSKDRQQWYDEEGWPIKGNALVTAWEPLPEPYKEGEA